MIVSGAAVTIGAPLVGRRSSGPRGHGRVDLHDGGVGATRVHVHGDRDLHVLGINAGAGNLTGQSYVDSVQLETGTTATAFGIASAAYSLGGSPTSTSSRSGPRMRVRRGRRSAVPPPPVSVYGGVPIGTQAQAYEVLDSEAPRGQAVLYRAVNRGTYAGQTLRRSTPRTCPSPR